MTNVIVRYPARGQAPEIFALRLNYALSDSGLLAYFAGFGLQRSLATQLPRWH